MVARIIANIANLRNREQKVKSFFISFYAIGLAGMIIPFTNPVFLKLTPVALLLSFLAVMLFHEKAFDKATIIVFISIFIAGFLIEVAGVNTGLIFGEYRYGRGLGPKLWETPLLIGINWLLLVYLSSGVVSRIKLNTLLSALVAPGIMLLYDLLLEQTAPYLDMWRWNNDVVPLKNYIAWYLIALVFHIFIKIFKIHTANRLSFVILICHMVFFAGLIIFQLFLP
ncbi:MAG: carotenoid biosynthesis protein [Bacteroidales bacterium]|nr:carotenoid biosynthesis protein [Bacteroidales bacterium]